MTLWGDLNVQAARATTRRIIPFSSFSSRTTAGGAGGQEEGDLLRGGHLSSFLPPPARAAKSFKVPNRWQGPVSYNGSLHEPPLQSFRRSVGVGHSSKYQFEGTLENSVFEMNLSPQLEVSNFETSSWGEWGGCVPPHSRATSGPSP